VLENVDPIQPFPFVAIVGQDVLKRALLLNAVNPRLGGVLIAGEKGTAKSTAVRSLAALLPDTEGVADCPYFCEPEGALCDECAERVRKDETLSRERRQVRVVDLPVSATEDRVVGALDLETAIREGRRQFEPGLLARAHRGFLYIDEVNLLDDHLVDLLLDAAAMGVNTVEREGLSYSHPAEFVLVGTMNPEEGELRPQLLDRFGLSVQVRGVDDPQARAEVVRRRLAYDADPSAFAIEHQEETNDLARQVVKARDRIATVKATAESVDEAVRISLEAETDGHRADLVMVKAAQALAAFQGDAEAGPDHVREVAALCLAHRLRRLPFVDARPLSFSWSKEEGDQ